jgi:hypothetical protein
MALALSQPTQPGTWPGAPLRIFNQEPPPLYPDPVMAQGRHRTRS